MEKVRNQDNNAIMKGKLSNESVRCAKITRCILKNASEDKSF
jgi:hypothetical protein